MRFWRRGSIITLAVVMLASCSAPHVAMRAYELSLVSGAAGTWAAWHGGGDDASSRIYLQKIDAEGRVLEEPRAISDGKRLAYEPDLILADDRLVVTWYEKDAATRSLNGRLGAFDLSGNLLWHVALGQSGSDVRNPVVRQVGKELAVAWIEQGRAAGDTADVKVQRFSLDGRPVDETQVIGRANRDTWNLNAAASGSSFVVTYDAANGTSAHEIQMAVVGPSNVKLRRISADDGHASLYPDLQVNGEGQAALTWFDEKDGNREVYLEVAPLDALGQTQPTRITHTRGDSIGAYLAWNGSTLGLAWSDEHSGQRDIYARLFDRSGHSAGPAKRVSSSSAGRASVPAIRSAGSGFMIAWNDYVAAGDSAHGSVTSSTAHMKWISGTRTPACQKKKGVTRVKCASR